MTPTLHWELRKFKDDIIIMARREIAGKLLALPQSEARDKLIEELKWIEELK